MTVVVLDVVVELVDDVVVEVVVVVVVVVQTILVFFETPSTVSDPPIHVRISCWCTH